MSGRGLTVRFDDAQRPSIWSDADAADLPGVTPEVCGWGHCGLVRVHPWHVEHDPSGSHSPLLGCHPYQPLVAP